MTAPAPEAAPIPADVWTAAKKALRLADKCERHEDFARRVTHIARAIMQDRADRASQEERITRADLASLLEEVRRPSASPENHLRQIGVMIERMMEVASGQEERIREDEREACAKIADDAARDARAGADRSEAKTTSGASVLTGYVFARTEAEAIAKAIRGRARLRGGAS